MGNCEKCNSPVILWFAGLSMGNQFAAGANPRGWAEAQARGKDVSVDELEARANEWREWMLELANGEHDEC